MAGLTLPAGETGLRAPPDDNSAVILGFYFQDFDNDQGREGHRADFWQARVRGFGYKVYEFIRVSAGVAFLQNEANGNGTPTIDIDDGLYLRPFVGITADISFWAGFFSLMMIRKDLFLGLDF